MLLANVPWKGYGTNRYHHDGDFSIYTFMNMEGQIMYTIDFYKDGAVRPRKWDRLDAFEAQCILIYLTMGGGDVAI